METRGLAGGCRAERQYRVSSTSTSLLRCHEVHMSIKCSPTYLHNIVIITTTTDKGFTKDDDDDVFLLRKLEGNGIT